MQNSDPESITLRRYCLRLVWLTPLFLLAIVLFTVVVDPYDVWHFVRFAPLNGVRDDVPFGAQEAGFRMRGLLAPPVTLVVGSSRVRRGFDEDAVAEAFGGPALLAGVDTVTPDRIPPLIASIAVPGRTRTIIIESSFMVGTACGQASRAKPGPEVLWFGLESLVGRQAVFDSVRTILMSLGLPSSNIRFPVAGHYRILARRPGSIVGNGENAIEDVQRAMAGCPADGLPSEDAAILRNTLALAKERAARVILLIMPFSPQWRAFTRRGGFEEAEAMWSTRTRAIAAEMGVTFCDYGHWVPGDDGPLADLPDYWDWIHFTARFGNAAIRDLAGNAGLCTGGNAGKAGALASPALSSQP